MLMKAIPKDLSLEAVQKRYELPEEVMLMIMVRYQPGSRKEKESLLQQIQSPEARWEEEKALSTLKLWKRRIERAKELDLSIPDPCILLSALDTITFNAVKKDPRRLLRLNSARESIGADVTTTEEVVNSMTTLLEAELEESVAASWSTITAKIKSVKGTPKGHKGKGGTKGNGKGDEGNGKGEKGKRELKETCWFFTESEDGCNKGQHCARYIEC